MDKKKLRMFEAARLCYDYNLSQMEVARTLEVSPATLTRLLQKAREEGIVKISVQMPEEYVKDIDQLESLMKKTLKIKTVRICPSSHSEVITRKNLGHTAAQWIKEIVNRDKMSLGFSGGRTVVEIVPFLKRPPLAVEIVQLMGGLSSTERAIQADVIARAVAAQMGGDCHVIHAPAIFPDAGSKRQLLANVIVAEVVACFTRIDVAVIGIGTLSTDNPLIQAGFVTERELKRLQSLGCVGDICGRFFDSSGKERDAQLADRILGIELQQLVDTPEVCAVVAGEQKVNAVMAAVARGVIKTLITDTRTAEQILLIKNK